MSRVSSACLATILLLTAACDPGPDVATPDASPSEVDELATAVGRHNGVLTLEL